MGRTLIGVVLAFFVVLVGLTAIMTRYEILPVEKGLVYRVDRWTGQTLLCVAATCTQVEVLLPTRPTSITPASAVPITATWFIEQDTIPNAPAIIAGNFDSRAACEETLGLAKTHKATLRWNSYSCRPVRSVSTDPNGHWWVVTTEDTKADILFPKGLKVGSRRDGPYASESVCEAARLDRDRFDGLRCERQ
jgi:hypothetical protein